MMTAWSFLVGVLPLVFSSGAGMLVATVVGIAFPPAYFAMFSRLRAKSVRKKRSWMKLMSSPITLSVTAQVNELAAAFEMGRRWSRITPDELRSKKVTNPNVADEVFKTVLTPPP